MGLRHMPRFRIEMLLASGEWVDAEWTVDGEPERFDTLEEAESALAEFREECADAVACGFLSDFDPEDYRIQKDE